MTASITPAPRPLCAAFAPLLPLISSGALDDDEATPAREHVAGCAWCRQELARYAAVDEALRRQFGAGASESVLPFLFDLDGDEVLAEDYAFALEDTLEETMAEGQDPRDQQPSTIARSPRWGDRKRGLSPRATAIAGIAAALILAVIATAVYTQFAARRTPSPAATKANGVFTKVAVPKMNYTSSWGFTTAPDGSFWFSELSSQDQAIGRVTPDGTNTEYPIPTDNTVRRVYINGMAVGSDGNIWFSGEETLTPSTLGAPGTYKSLSFLFSLRGKMVTYLAFASDQTKPSGIHGLPITPIRLIRLGRSGVCQPLVRYGSLPCRTLRN